MSDQNSGAICAIGCPAHVIVQVVVLRCRQGNVRDFHLSSEVR